MIVKLRDHSYANAHVVIRDDAIILVSYSTVVAQITDVDDTICLIGYGRFSATTCNHIRWFTEQFCGSNLYSVCKRGSPEKPVTCSINVEALRAELRRLEVIE